MASLCCGPPRCPAIAFAFKPDLTGPFLPRAVRISDSSIVSRPDPPVLPCPQLSACPTAEFRARGDDAAVVGFGGGRACTSVVNRLAQATAGQCVFAFEQGSGWGSRANLRSTCIQLTHSTRARSFAPGSTATLRNGRPLADVASHRCVDGIEPPKKYWKETRHFTIAGS